MPGRQQQLFLNFYSGELKSYNWDTQNTYHNCPKYKTVQFFNAVMHLKDVDGMANAADPDQTAPSGAV